MTSKLWWQTVSAVLVGICAALTLHYVFLRIVTVLTLFALGLLVAWVMEPAIHALQRLGWTRTVAIWGVTLGILVVVVIGGILVVPGLVSQAQDAAVHWRDYSQKAQDTYHSWRQEIAAYAASKYPNAPIMDFLDSREQVATQWLSEHIPAILQWVSAQVLASMGLVAAGAMLLIISFHFMNVIEPWRQGIRDMLPQSADEQVGQVGGQINLMLGQYLRGMVMISVAVGATVACVLTGLGFVYHTKYALILGVIAGLTYVIPYLGPILTSVCGGFFAYVTTTSGTPWIPALASIALVYATFEVYDVVVTPRVVGHRVGLHPLVILFSVFSGLSLLGIPGMIIATPVAASIKIILAHWLPIKMVDYTAPHSKRRLDIDVAASLNLVGRNLVRLGKDIERAVTPEHEHAGREKPRAEHETAPKPPEKP